MKVIGLDPSLTSYGWCLCDFTAPSIVLSKGCWKTKAHELFIARYIFLRECIADLCKANPDVLNIGVESPPFGELWSEGLYGLFLFAIESLYRAKRNVFFWDPSTVKSRAREILERDGGKMFKSDMIDAAKRMSPIKKWKSDEADAFHVAHLTHRFVSFLDGNIIEKDLTVKEKWIFTGEKTKRNGQVIKRGMIFKESDRYFLFGEDHGDQHC